MVVKRIASAAMATLLLAACATSPNNISPTYVSPLQYQHYSCDQIRVELQRIGVRVSEVTGQQQRAANNDAVAMGVGLVLFWPALFFLASDNNKREELARLRGEYEALQQAANEKSCFAQQASAPANSAPPAPIPAPAPTETVAPAEAVAPGGSEPTP